MRLRFAALLAVLATVGLIVAACGSSATPTPVPTTRPTATTAPTTGATSTGGAATSAPTATRAPTATTAPAPTAAPTATAAPVSTGALVIALDNLGSFELSGGGSGVLAAQKPYLDSLFDYTIGATNDGKLDTVSGIVASWTASADNRTLTFKTRDTISFHDGSKATSADVKFNFDRQMSPTRLKTPNATLLRVINTVTTPDASTVVVTFKQNDIFFTTNQMSRLGNAVASQYLLPGAYIDRVTDAEADKKPVGSGPFKYVSATVGNELNLEAVARHWFYGVPRVKNLSYKLIPEEGTRIALLQTGAADVIPVSKSQVKAIQGRSGLQVFKRTEAGEGTVRFEAQFVETYAGIGKNPFFDPKVRQALAHFAIDRKAIVDGFLAGLGRPTVSMTTVAPADPSYIEIPVPAYDLAKAKQLLTEASFPNGFEADFYIFPRPSYPEGLEIMESVAVMMEKAGLKVNRKPTQFPTFLAMIQADKKFSRPTMSGSFFVGNIIGAGAQFANEYNSNGLFAVNYSTVMDGLAKAWVNSATLDEYVKNGKAYQEEAFKLATHGGGGYTLFATGEVFGASAKVPSAWNLGSGGGSWNFEKMAAIRSGGS